MGKLIRTVIEYGGGNGTDIFEVTQAEYDALVQAGTLVHNALYVITDAPNLNATAQDISYDGGADTVWDKVEAVKVKVLQDTKTTTAQGYVDLGLDARNYQILQVTPVENAANTIAFKAHKKIHRLSRWIFNNRIP